ncbi:ABC transporter permease [Propylenella binzhouense]|uniref:ABC transporter permease n=1 Tax=Propylenella binzhouense TaxID=2555902 RepID=A0A964T2G8_9HYPH|nr:ABC transporter permease [Propylenella binzhouense]MYZ47079.1 ABC transporter permease [Propylenella binzhouense]
MIRVRLERREVTPAWLQVAIPIASVLVTLVLCAALVRAAGADVIEAYRILLLSTFRSGYDVQDTLVKAAPLLFTGLAVLVAFRAKFWNIGAEGQLMAGAVAACFVGERTFLPAVSLVPLMIVSAALFGALWALLPALLKVRLKVDDVVTTLLLNFIMLYGVTALLEGPWRDPKSGYPNAPSVRIEAEFPLVPGLGVHLGVALALAAALLVWWMMSRTTLGFRIRAVGHNPAAAAYAGIGVGRVILTAALVSGALAGLAGAGEVGGVRFQVTSDLSSGYGYAGIVVATLAELNPLGAVPAALFFAIVFNGAGTMARATGVPIYLADVIQGVALVTMVAGRLFATYRPRLVRPLAPAPAPGPEATPSPLAGRGGGVAAEGR